MRLLQRIVAGLSVLGVAFVFAACGGDDTSSDTSAAPTSAATTTAPPTDTTSPTTPATSPPATTSPTVPPTSPPPTTVPPTTVPPTTEPATLIDVKVYFLRDERLVIAHRQVPGPAVLHGAIDALLAGPTAAEAAAGMTSAIPAGTDLRGVDLDAAGTDDGGLATVDLTATYGSGGGSLSMTARVTQVVFTATQFDNVGAVRFWIDGSPVDYLGGEGLVLTEPQTRAMMPRDITGAVIIDTPHPGTTVTDPIRVTGEGDVFEAQFPMELWRDGEQIGGVYGVWAGAWGRWGEFDVTIPIDAAPGPIDIVAYDAGGCGDAPECPEPIRTVVRVELG
jgi:germination protein M